MRFINNVDGDLPIMALRQLSAAQAAAANLTPQRIATIERCITDS
jgi:hypothetical protein